MFPSVAVADPVADFYRGKPVNLIVSTGTGGGDGEYAQIFAQFYGKHIPGSPSVVAQFMPAPGGLRATNFLFSSAPKDGSTIGFVFGTMVTAEIFSPDQARFKSADFNWIGNMDGELAVALLGIRPRQRLLSTCKTVKRWWGARGSVDLLTHIRGS